LCNAALHKLPCSLVATLLDGCPEPVVVNGSSASYTCSAVGRASGSFPSIDETSASSSKGTSAAGRAQPAPPTSGAVNAAAGLTS